MYCEFLDTEWYFDAVPVSRPTYKRLPVWLIRSIAQPSRVRKILTTDEDILSDLSLSVARYGLLKPIILKLDKNGRITLFDGHHRMIVAERLGIQEMPFTIEVCKSLSLETTPISDIIHELVS
jgi:hypothetical protein